MSSIVVIETCISLSFITINSTLTLTCSDFLRKTGTRRLAKPFLTNRGKKTFQKYRKWPLELKPGENWKRFRARKNSFRCLYLSRVFWAACNYLLSPTLISPTFISPISYFLLPSLPSLPLSLSPTLLSNHMSPFPCVSPPVQSSVALESD